MEKFEEIFYEFEDVLKNLDAEFQEFAEATCERLDKMEDEQKEPSGNSGKTDPEPDSPKKKT